MKSGAGGKYAIMQQPRRTMAGGAAWPADVLGQGRDVGESHPKILSEELKN